MEPKKSPKVDLEKKRSIFLELGLLIVISGVLLAFEWTTRPATDKMSFQREGQEMEEEIIPITEQKEPEPEPPKPPKVTEEIEIVQDDIQLEDEFILEDMEADQETAMDMTFDMGEEEEAEEEVFVIVEDMPRFKGKSQDAFRQWIAQNLEYPQVAADNNISGTVIVQFAINSKGEVVDVRVVRGVHPALDKEAKRVIESSPKWSPGRQRGKAVKVQFTFPINFVLNQ
jgi:periplasmic protein TonB